VIGQVAADWPRPHRKQSARIPRRKRLTRAVTAHARSHLGLARAYAAQGQTAKAHAAYEDFLTLWKDADPDIPILKQAKEEYAKLQ
jgi:hypothetical protein